MVFAEFFPNPAWKPLGHAVVSQARAFAIEAAGTAVLMLAILGVTDARNRERVPAAGPWIIGLTVTILISLLGPFTMACFNPARDLAPRVYAALAGWGAWPFRANGWGWLTVYLVAPIMGAQIGAWIYRSLLAPAYAAATKTTSHHTASCRRRTDRLF